MVLEERFYGDKVLRKQNSKANIKRSKELCEKVRLSLIAKGATGYRKGEIGYIIPKEFYEKDSNNLDQD